MSKIFRSFLVLSAITFVGASLTGCTCNRTNEVRTQARADKRAAIMRDRKKKLRNGQKARKGKQKGRANISRTDVTLWLVDKAKVVAGEDPWVKVTRKVGAHRPVKNAVWVLFKGPTLEESERGLTFINSGANGFQGFSLMGNTVSLQLRGGCDSSGGTITVFDHIQKTLAEFPEVKYLKVLDADGNTATPDGKSNSRPDCLEP